MGASDAPCKVGLTQHFGTSSQFYLMLLLIYVLYSALWAASIELFQAAFTSADSSSSSGVINGILAARYSDTEQSIFCFKIFLLVMTAANDCLIQSH